MKINFLLFSMVIIKLHKGKQKLSKKIKYFTNSSLMILTSRAVSFTHYALGKKDLLITFNSKLLSEFFFKITLLDQALLKAIQVLLIIMKIKNAMII